MSGKIKSMFKPGKNSVGKKDPSGGEVTVLLAGAGIVVNQAIVNYDPDTREAVIAPNAEDPNKNKTTVNGELLLEERPLVHGDRILFGSHHYFIYCDPTINPEEMFDWEDAMKEANKEQMMMAGTDNNEEIQRQLREMEEKLQREKEAKEKEIEEQKRKMEEEKQQMLNELKKKQEEMDLVKNDEIMKKMQEEMERARIEFEEKLREQEEMLQRQ